VSREGERIERSINGGGLVETVLFSRWCADFHVFRGYGRGYIKGTGKLQPADEASPMYLGLFLAWSSRT